MTRIPIFTLCLLLMAQWAATSPSRAADALPVHDKAIVWTKGNTSVDVHYFTTGIPSIDKLTGQPDVGEEIDPRNIKDVTDGSYNASFSAGYRVTRNDSKMFAVVFSSNDYEGGAHGLPSEHSLSFLMPSGQLVLLPELVDGRRGLEKISRLAIADIIRQFEKAGVKVPEMDYINNGAGPDGILEAAYAWLPDELVLTIDGYSIGAGYAGGREIHIPMSELTDVIRADPTQPMPSLTCEIAKTKIEKTICSNVELARLDWELALRYRESISLCKNLIATTKKYPGPTPARQQMQNQEIETQQARLDKLISDQRAWLEKRNAKCTSGGADCLQDSYKERLKQQF